jgi:hypothetical protein
MVALTLALAQLALSGAPAGHAPPASGGAAGSVSVVHALTGGPVTVRVDGRVVERRVEPGQVVGPITLPAGRHRVSFRRGGEVVRRELRVRPGTESDLVLHAPADPQASPELTLFRGTTTPPSRGKARIVVAATAGTVPADVLVDGRVVFTNIADGEAARAVVGPGRHRVSLVPTGRPGPAVVGPVPITVPAGAVATLYPVAHARPIVAVRRPAPSRTPAPRRVDTGTTGGARDLPVRTFGVG